jgi:hypothetical protein
MHIKRFKLSLVIIIAALVLSACGASAGDATPTTTSTPVDVKALSTSVALTVVAQITQTAFNMPTATRTNTPTLTPTSATPQATRPQVLPTSTNCATYTFISDVTIPDGTTMPVGQEFTKTWRVKNTGTCPWTTSFALVFSYGEQMGGQTVKLPAAVPVGSETDISIVLKVPNKTGQLSGAWTLVDDKGQYFGSILTVVIKVGNPSPTATPTGSTATPSLTPTASETPTETATP